MTIQKQHVDLYRKLLLRKRLLGDWCRRAYVPFIGNGDIAAELYRDMQIDGADIDPDRVATARERLPAARIVVADCNVFPFERAAPYDLADFDAYNYPYDAFRSWFCADSVANRCVIFFTDACRMALTRGKGKTWRAPSGEYRDRTSVTAMRTAFNFYVRRILEPWFAEAVQPWVVRRRMSYHRRQLIYAGFEIVKAETL